MKRVIGCLVALILFIPLGCGGNQPQSRESEMIVCIDIWRGPLTARQADQLAKETFAREPTNKKENWQKFTRPQYVKVAKHLCDGGRYICGKPYLAEQYVIGGWGKSLFVIITDEQGEKGTVLISNLEKESEAGIREELSRR